MKHAAWIACLVMGSGPALGIDVAIDAEALATGGGPKDRQNASFSTSDGIFGVQLSADTGSATADVSVSVSLPAGGATVRVVHTIDSGPVAVAGGSSSGAARFDLTEPTDFALTGLLEQISTDPAGGGNVRIRNTTTFVTWFQAGPDFSLPNNPIDFSAILSEGTLPAGSYEMTWFHAGNHTGSSDQTVALGDFTLTLGSMCAADLDGNGVLNFFDVSMFITAFGAMDPVADLDSNGEWNFFDVSAYLTLYAAGCP